MTKYCIRALSVAACGVVVSMMSGAAASGQAPAAPATTSGAVVGTGVFTAFVENMDRSLAFYHDVFGMDVPALPASGARPYNRANPRLFAMFDIPGARERHQSARVPGTRLAVEVMDIQDVDHKTIDLHVQDPGAATLVLEVRDLDAVLGRVKQAGLPTVTKGWTPVTLADGARAVIVRDVDNRFLEIEQPASAPAAGGSTSDVVGLRLSIAVSDLDRTRHVYKDVLGFEVTDETKFTADKAVRALTGLSKVQVRHLRAQAHGSMLPIEFVEYKGVARTPLHMKIQDRGAARLQLRAQNIDALVAAMKAAGLHVVSDGAVAVPIPPNLKGALVADPDNFFLTPFEPCDGCASFGPRRGGRE